MMKISNHYKIWYKNAGPLQMVKFHSLNWNLYVESNLISIQALW